MKGRRMKMKGKQVIQGVAVRLLVTGFTNAISCFEPDRQEPYRDTLYNKMHDYIFFSIVLQR
jgi:hypothetical protein